MNTQPAQTEQTPDGDRRWRAGLMITPTLIRGYPARFTLTVGDQVTEAIAEIQKQLAPLAIPSELDGQHS